MIDRSTQSQSGLAAKLRQHMLNIDNDAACLDRLEVVVGCFGRITSVATRESRSLTRGYLESGPAGFRGVNSRKPAISNPPACQKPNPAQRFAHCSTDDTLCEVIDARDLASARVMVPALARGSHDRR